MRDIGNKWYGEKSAVSQDIKYEIVSELASSELVITFQQLEKERRREIRENILNTKEKLVIFTIRDDYMLKHQERMTKNKNNISKEWKGKVLKNNRIDSYKVYHNKCSDDCSMYNRGGEFILVE
jgi:hypothetical protein